MLRLVLLMTMATACGTQPPRRPRTEPSGPARYSLDIVHHHDMSATYQLMELAYTFDGAPVYSRRSETEPLEAPVCVLQRLVQRGTHDVGVEIGYRGHGEGVFSYLSGYRFHTTSTYAVDVPGDAFGVHVIGSGYEGGGPTSPLEERPKVRWATEVERSNPNAGCRSGR